MINSKDELKIDIQDIPNRNRTNTPTLTYCRKLIKDGIDPNTILEVYRGDVLSMSVIVGEAAKLTVKEDPYPHFAKYEGSFFLDRPAKTPQQGPGLI